MIGSAAAIFFEGRGWKVHGIDNNMRRDFFGPDGDTTWNLEFLKKTLTRFEHHEIDIRDRGRIRDTVAAVRPDFIIHAAAQPSHDLACRRPYDDFDVNAVGTLNMLEAARNACPETPFVFTSTNKVYGDAPNELELVEKEKRYDYAEEKYFHGIDESCRIDSTLHSLFGASKAAADVLVQEYGRYFGMPTVCFRGGCLTGTRHSGAELHGFLAYLAKCVKEDRVYRIFGYKGKQVRDNIHSHDVCAAFLAFYENPRSAAVYNLGGQRANSISVLEAIERFEAMTGKKLKTEYVDKNRIGDHICYISDMRKFKRDYPGWEPAKSLEDIFTDFLAPESGGKTRASARAL